MMTHEGVLEIYQSAMLSQCGTSQIDESHDRPDAMCIRSNREADAAW